MSLFRTLSARNRKRLMFGLGGAAGILLVALGVFASNGWLPKTDPMTGQKYGWFGKELPKHATSAWNPLPPPDPTPQLSKEYIYAGSRLLVAEDANAAAAPPADIAVWRGSNGYWYVMGQTGSSATNAQWGTSGDIPVPGDYDGDGKTDFAIFRPGDGYWWIYFSATSTYTAIQYGQSGDKPVPADYDGDGKTDIGVARPVGSPDYELDWFITLSGGGTLTGEFGLDTDTPGQADFDGDGRADIGLYRSSNDEYYWINSSNEQLGVIDLNNNGDKVVSSDYDGDGKADHAVYNSSTGYWYIRSSISGMVSAALFGASGYLPVQNDYDLDGRTDLAVWDNASTALWAIKKSSDASIRYEYFGTTGDIPVPAFYRR